MFKGLITAGAYTSGYIPMTQYQNTNSIYSLNGSNNTISITESGITDVKVRVLIKATAAGAISLELFGNDAKLNGAEWTVTAAQGSNYTLTINDAVLITNQVNQRYATLGIKLSGACTIVGGEFICEHRR